MPVFIITLPATLKARVCVQGARRLRSWCQAEGLPVLACGKVITPQAEELDGQLDMLLERGRANGAEVRLLNEANLISVFPMGALQLAGHSGVRTPVW